MFTVQEYKGNMVIVLRRDEKDKFQFSFGLGKAKLVLDNIDGIKEFVATKGGKEGGECQSK